MRTCTHLVLLLPVFPTSLKHRERKKKEVVLLVNVGNIAGAPYASPFVSWGSDPRAMALRSAVAVGSEVPTGLWSWIDSDVYAYEGFIHATICHRPAWLYQRFYAMFILTVS